MGKRLITLTLVFTVFSCPFVCGMTPKARAISEPVKPCCCCCHEAAPPANGDPPSQAPHDDDYVCQCICNGAVVDHVVLPPAGINLDYWMPVAVKATSAKSACNPTDSIRTCEKVDDAMNPGRAMRCLFMSYLC
jgi:hypothetical protein